MGFSITLYFPEYLLSRNQENYGKKYFANDSDISYFGIIPCLSLNGISVSFCKEEDTNKARDNQKSISSSGCFLHVCDSITVTNNFMPIKLEL